MLEKSGLIREVGEWVLRNACAQCRQWHDTVKINLRLIEELVNGGDSALMMAGILSIANSLGHSVVTVGIETLAQLNFLGTHGCHQMQGYFHSKPLPVGMFEAY
jgi:EAL domain-containing protein (putative c-di-GMP-specific phosphodiesterase class I)